MLTNWMDPILGPIGRRTGVAEEEYVAWTGGQFLGKVFEIVQDLTLKGWANVAVKLLTAVAAYIGASRPGVDIRTKRELEAIANMELLSLLDVIEDPSFIEELKASISKLRGGEVLGSAVRSISEVRMKLSGILGYPKAPATSQAGFFEAKKTQTGTVETAQETVKATPAIDVETF